jgi:glucan biosynthesis protein C
VPLLYYGVQAVAAPFFPGFSFLGTTASALGSDRSNRPRIFNAGTILVGIAALVASLGFLRALLRVGAHPILAWITSIEVAATGIAGLCAGIFPLPDPRHSGYAALSIAMLLLPFTMATTFWTLGVSRPLKDFFAATIVLLLVMYPVMSGMTGLDTHNYRGILRRIFSLVVFPQIGVGAYVMTRKILKEKDSESEPDELLPTEQRERAGSVHE